MSDFVSYSDWLNANQGNGSRAAPSAGPSVADAYKAGGSGGYASYGDFLAAQSANGPAPSQNPYDAMLTQGTQQNPYDMQAAGAQAAFGAGQRNANTAGAAQQMSDWQNQQRMAGARRAGVTGDLGTGSQADVLKAGKQAQQASRDAGAQYRLAQERKAFEADQKRNAGIEQGVSAILNPIGGIGWASTDFGHGHSTDFSRFTQDPFGIGGNAHSGFGPGGKFGSPLGMGSSAQGDPFGQYSQDDAGFGQWLAAHGYNTTTGNGGGY